MSLRWRCYYDIFFSTDEFYCNCPLFYSIFLLLWAIHLIIFQVRSLPYSINFHILLFFRCRHKIFFVLICIGHNGCFLIIDMTNYDWNNMCQIFNSQKLWKLMVTNDDTMYCYIRNYLFQQIVKISYWIIRLKIFCNWIFYASFSDKFSDFLYCINENINRYRCKTWKN